MGRGRRGKERGGGEHNDTYISNYMCSMKSPWKPKVKVQTIFGSWRKATPEQRQQHIATEAESREWQHLSKDNDKQD